LSIKGLVLSGGRGVRLRPITHTTAKQLVPVANKPILFYGLEALSKAGIIDVGIVVGETKSEIMDSLGDGSRWNMKLTYIEQEAPLGLAHAVKIARNFIADDRFVMYLGDNIIREDLSKLVKDFNSSHANAQILLAHVPNAKEFGVAELERNRVIRLIEKPDEPPSDLALVGVYFFDSSIFPAIEQLKPSWRNELEITEAIQYLIDKNFRVESHIIEGWWKDTGKVEDLLDANHFILDEMEPVASHATIEKSKIERRVNIDSSAKIVSSVIRGPAVIGKDVVVKNSHIGPYTSIAESSMIKDSEVENSILMEEVQINGIRHLRDSLIGRGVILRRSEGKPHAYRIVVGDQSRLALL